MPHTEDNMWKLDLLHELEKVFRAIGRRQGVPYNLSLT
jgi:hypothetical protein